MQPGVATTEGLTARVAEEVSSLRYEDFSRYTLARSRHVLLDWLGAVIAGSVEPAGRIAQSLAEEAGSRPASSIIGTPLRCAARDAALANAIAAHALDFDDSSLWADGHPSAAIVSAAVALGETLGSTTGQVVEAVVAGVQGQARIALATGPSAYAKGFHGTATYGTFGAAGACARLLGLDAGGLERTYGLAATQAAGLKVVFGTMGKHLNAGKAASDGMLAAQLVARGFTAPGAAIEGHQGFAWTHSTSFDTSRPDDVMGDRLAIESILFKRHAACHGTHSSIEGITRLRAEREFTDSHVSEVRLYVSEKMLDICCISEPATGLEGKFSVRHAASVALAGLPTGPEAFTDQSVHEPRLMALRERVIVEPEPERELNGPTRVLVTLTSGDRLQAEVDVFETTPDAELASEWMALVDKFKLLATPLIGTGATQELIERIAHLEPQLPITQLLDVSELPRRPGHG